MGKGQTTPGFGGPARCSVPSRGACQPAPEPRGCHVCLASRCSGGALPGTAVFVTVSIVWPVGLPQGRCPWRLL